MKIALVKNRIVENIIEADADFTMDGYDAIASETAHIGATYANDEFSEPEAVPPSDENIALARTARLAAIDFESMRPLRAICAKADTKADRDKLAALEAEAVQLRKT